MSRLPSHFEWLQSRFPVVASAYEAYGDAVHAAGPLDPKTRALVKVAISGAARLEGGLHAHCRKALRAGASESEILHTLLLLFPTVGFPGTMAALAWARDVLKGDGASRRSRREKGTNSPKKTRR